MHTWPPEYYTSQVPCVQGAATFPAFTVLPDMGAPHICIYPRRIASLPVAQLLNRNPSEISGLEGKLSQYGNHGQCKLK